LIAVSIGPGSYSGIRIGISTALGLGHALSIPVTGISALEALASCVAVEKLVALVPIGKSDFAWQLFVADPGGKKRASVDPTLDSTATLFNSLSVHGDFPIVVPSYCFESIKQIGAERREIIDAGANLASAIARLALEKVKMLRI
jgi:tRNA threonylcarbamoyl adenosine modification protein YeaZ